MICEVPFHFCVIVKKILCNFEKNKIFCNKHHSSIVLGIWVLLKLLWCTENLIHVLFMQSWAVDIIVSVMWPHLFSLLLLRQRYLNIYSDLTLTYAAGVCRWTNNADGNMAVMCLLFTIYLLILTLFCCCFILN